MPFTHPLMFGASTLYDAIIEFGACSSGGGQDRTIYNSAPSVTKDVNNDFGTPNTSDSNYKWVPFNNFGTYRFSIIEPAAFTSKETAADVTLVEIRMNGTSLVDTNDIFVVYTDSAQSPSPKDQAIADDAFEDGLALEFPVFEDYSFSGMTIGVKKIS